MRWSSILIALIIIPSPRQAPQAAPTLGSAVEATLDTANSCSGCNGDLLCLATRYWHLVVLLSVFSLWYYNNPRARIESSCRPTRERLTNTLLTVTTNSDEHKACRAEGNEQIQNLNTLEGEVKADWSVNFRPGWYWAAWKAWWNADRLDTRIKRKPEEVLATFKAKEERRKASKKGWHWKFWQISPSNSSNSTLPGPSA